MNAKELFLNHNRLKKFYKGVDLFHGVILDIITIVKIGQEINLKRIV